MMGMSSAEYSTLRKLPLWVFVWPGMNGAGTGIGAPSLLPAVPAIPILGGETTAGAGAWAWAW